jgi:hypothetical protein
VNSGIDVVGALNGIIEDVIQTKGQAFSALADETPLAELPLESMDWAEVVVRMETDTGVDPFSTGESFQLQTLGDLRRVYAQTGQI